MVSIDKVRKERKVDASYETSRSFYLHVICAGVGNLGPSGITPGVGPKTRA